MSEKTKAFMDRAKEQTIGCEIDSNQGGSEILRNTGNGSPRRRFIRRLELQRHSGQNLESDERRKHFGKHRYS